MGYQPLEKLLDKAEGSIYKLVILASQRALEIAEGAPKLINSNEEIKPTSIALSEIAEGKVRARKIKK
jgi:DNA-directed RNA polymerase omega subunit